MIQEKLPNPTFGRLYLLYTLESAGSLVELPDTAVWQRNI